MTVKLSTEWQDAALVMSQEVIAGSRSPERPLGMACHRDCRWSDSPG